jgi:hypothetical protein
MESICRRFIVQVLSPLYSGDESEGPFAGPMLETLVPLTLVLNLPKFCGLVRFTTVFGLLNQGRIGMLLVSKRTPWLSLAAMRRFSALRIAVGNGEQCRTAFLALMAAAATRNLQLADPIDASRVRIPLSPPYITK